MTRTARLFLIAGLVLLGVGDAALAQAFPRMQGPTLRARPGVASDHAVRPPGRLLGTFYPEATVNIMGSDPVRRGYAPLGMYGTTPLDLYGPLSVFRTKSAPIVTYQRGYGGIARPSLGIATSYPNFPIASPVVYPTRANYYRHFPTSGVPPTWRKSDSWLDQE